MTDAAQPEPGWYVCSDSNFDTSVGDGAHNPVACVYLPNDAHILRHLLHRQGWTLGPRIEDLLRDAEHYRELIDAEIARGKAS